MTKERGYKMIIILIFLSFNLSANIEYPFDENGDLTDRFVTSLAYAESTFRHNVVSNKGAYGYFQILPIACEDANNDLDEDIDCGKDHKPDYDTQFKVMSHNIKKWFKKTGDIYKTLYIYNQGRGNFIANENKTNGEYDYSEHKYVRKVVKAYEMYDKIYGYQKTKYGYMPVMREQ